MSMQVLRRDCIPTLESTQPRAMRYRLIRELVRFAVQAFRRVRLPRRHWIRTEADSDSGSRTLSGQYTRRHTSWGSETEREMEFQREARRRARCVLPAFRSLFAFYPPLVSLGSTLLSWLGGLTLFFFSYFLVFSFFFFFAPRNRGTD